MRTWLAILASVSALALVGCTTDEPIVAGDDDDGDDDTSDDDTETDDDQVWCHPAAEIRVPADCAAIQAAIEAVDDGGTVYVSAGDYMENLDFLGKDVRMIAVDGVYATVITPDTGSAVTFSGGETEAAALAGFTLYEGWGVDVSPDGDHGHRAGGGVVVDNNYDGGGIHMHGSTAVMDNVRITGNSHDGPGGGLFLEASHVTLVNEWWLPGGYDPATSPDLDCADGDPDVFPGQGC